MVFAFEDVFRDFDFDFDFLELALPDLPALDMAEFLNFRAARRADAFPP